MPESFDFSKMAKIAPRADSWDKVVARIQAKKARKILPFRLFSSLSVAGGSVPVKFPDFTRGAWKTPRKPGIVEF